jgi:hypothetical protein
VPDQPVARASPLSSLRWLTKSCRDQRPGGLVIPSLSWAGSLSGAAPRSGAAGAGHERGEDPVGAHDLETAPHPGWLLRAGASGRDRRVRTAAAARVTATKVL